MPSAYTHLSTQQFDSLVSFSCAARILDREEFSTKDSTPPQDGKPLIPPPRSKNCATGATLKPDQRVVHIYITLNPILKPHQVQRGSILKNTLAACFWSVAYKQTLYIFVHKTINSSHPKKCGMSPPVDSNNWKPQLYQPWQTLGELCRRCVSILLYNHEASNKGKCWL